MIDLSSPALRRNPFPVYAQVRAASPILEDPAAGCWLLFDYASVKQALTDTENFSSNMALAGRGNPEWLIFLDPPRHNKLRALISSAFTPAAIGNLEPRIRELSHELLRNMAERREIDLVADYAAPLPTMVIAEMIGFPRSEWALFRKWSDSILQLSHTIFSASAAAVAEYRLAKTQLAEYMGTLIDARKTRPEQDLLSRLIHAEIEGERLTDSEIIGFVELLMVAGQETTSNLISNAILCFMENPAELEKLRGHPDLLVSAMEEVLRYRSPVQWLFRATTRDVVLGGTRIPAGKLVIPVIGAANRDPHQFEQPERFDIERKPNPHIAFGHGIHFCLGAPLSRLEARIAIPDLLQALGQFTTIAPDAWEPRAALHVHGPARLPLCSNGHLPSN